MKDNSIIIGKYIKQFLLANENIFNQVNGTINSWVVPNNTPFPYIIFYRTSVTPIYTKDGLLCSEVNFDIDVIHNNYDIGVEIANEVRNTLENKHFKDDTINIKHITLTNISESFQYDSFVQKLSFKTQAR